MIDIVRKEARIAFKQTAHELNEEFQRMISEPQQWDGFEDSTTLRANGTVVSGSYRNIEDLGNLLSSQKMDLEDESVIYSWDGNGITPVAAIFFGTRTASSYTPGRDWITPALINLNISEEFKNKMERRLE